MRSALRAAQAATFAAMVYGLVLFLALALWPFAPAFVVARRSTLNPTWRRR